MRHHSSQLNLPDQNLFEISIGSKSSAKKKYPHVRRVGLMSSLGALSEPKRPGEYYLQKLSQSSVNLTSKQTKRPGSGISVASDNSKDSDDMSLLGSSQFDCPDSRLSSMTNNSLYSSKVGVSSPKQLSVDSSAVDVTSDLDPMCSSISTITLKSDMQTPKSQLHDAATMGDRKFAPKLRTASTSSVLEQKAQAKPLPPLMRTRTASSSFLLGRSKSKYFSSKESKGRQQLRKKVYDDNDNDDEILTNDLDLVFNVPVIKNQAEIYRYHKSSSTSVLSHHDLTLDNDKYGTLNTPVSMKPSPLPGKLNTSFHIDTGLPSMPEDSTLDTPNQLYVADMPTYNNDDDSEISQNISLFYTQRSLSYSKLVKLTREQQMIYKLPSYVRSQSSIEDISLMSPEKLEVVDQSRPINLPPKNADDKLKHSKEFHLFLAGYESATKSQNDARRKIAERYINNQQAWSRLLSSTDDKKEFSKQLSLGKEKWRRLNWETLVPEKQRFAYFMRILTLNLGNDYPAKVEEKLKIIETKFQSLSDKMRATKDAEFGKVIDQVLKRPVYVNFLNEVAGLETTDFDVNQFEKNFKHLLYIKSLSDGGLKTYHEIFVIPMFLILFQQYETFTSICVMIEMFDKCIFTPEFFGELNTSLSTWKNLSLMSSSSTPYRILKKFTDLKEFENLSSFHFFEIIVQLNDRLPLSLSAPSTPCIAQGSYTPLASAKQSLDGADVSPERTKSFDSIDAILTSVYSRSSSLSLIGIYLQLLVTYSSSPRSKKRNFLKIFQSFLLTIFQFYHINWNSSSELVKGNKSIKLNKSSDQLTNLESFLDKWKEIFKKM